MIEEWTRGWKGAVLFIIWAAAFILLFYDSAITPGRIRFTRELNVIRLNSADKNARCDAWMLYSNQSSSKKSMTIFYPVYSEDNQPFPKSISLEEMKGKPETLESLFPTVEMIGMGEDPAAKLSLSKKEAEISPAGVFMKITLDAGEAAIIRAQYEQKFKISEFDNRFGYAFTMSAGWGRGIDEGAYVIIHDDRMAIRSVAATPNVYRHQQMPFKKLANVVQGEPSYVNDQEGLPYVYFKGKDFVDPGMSIFIGEAK